jgi:hypothetical protein
MSVARKGAWTALGAVVSAVGLLAGAGSALAETKTFTSTGAEQQFTVPAGVTSVHVVAIGSGGGATTAPASGRGGVVSGTLAVTPEHVLYVEVGGVPFNGGGVVFEPGFSGDGGGASDVRTVSIGAEPSPGNKESLDHRLLVAAGGGGGGGKDVFTTTCAGGVGGNAEEKGADGTSCGLKPGEGGGAGEANKGGTGGKGYKGQTEVSENVGETGGLGRGGKSFLGGGGGGLYGGGGGGSQNEQNSEGVAGGGGGGGSNLVPPGGEAKIANAGQAASVTFTYTLPIPTSKDQCKNGGWKNFGTMFKNQGQCVKFVETGR